MKKIKNILLFFVFWMIYHLSFSGYFPVDENNDLQAPDWYMFVGIGFALAMTIAFRKRKILLRSIVNKIKKAKHKNNIVIKEKTVVEEKSVVIPHIECDPAILVKAAFVVFETQQASVSMIERKLGLGYAEAAPAIDKMEYLGIISRMEGTKPRKILVSQEEALRLIFAEENPVLDQVKCSSVDSLAEIDCMEGHQFEYWCAEVLKRNGFKNVEVTPGSGDQGVDILAVKDGVKYAIQCKRYASNLDNTPIQEVNAGKQYYRCHIGVVMTNSYFTSKAKELAESTGTLLWDRDKLKEML